MVGLTKYIIMPVTGAGSDDWKDSDIIANFAFNKAGTHLKSILTIFAALLMFTLMYMLNIGS